MLIVILPIWSQRWQLPPACGHFGIQHPMPQVGGFSSGTEALAVLKLLAGRARNTERAFAEIRVQKNK
eukprot:2296008-Alexandrium_andersonii.AAC.1